MIKFSRILRERKQLFYVIILDKLISLGEFIQVRIITTKENQQFYYKGLCIQIGRRINSNYLAPFNLTNTLPPKKSTLILLLNIFSNFNFIQDPNYSAQALIKFYIPHEVNDVLIVIQQSMKLQENQEVKRITIDFSPTNKQVQKDKEINRLVRQLSHTKQSTKKYKKIIDRIKQSRIRQAQDNEQRYLHQDKNKISLALQKSNHQVVESSKKRRVRYHYLIETLRNPCYEEERNQKQKTNGRKTLTVQATEYSSLDNHSRVHEIHRLRRLSQASSSLKRGCDGKSFFLADAMVRQNLSVKKMKNSITNSYKIATMPISRPITASKPIHIKRKYGIQKENHSTPLKKIPLFGREDSVIKPWDWGEDICVELI